MSPKLEIVLPAGSTAISIDEISSRIAEATCNRSESIEINTFLTTEVTLENAKHQHREFLTKGYS